MDQSAPNRPRQTAPGWTLVTLLMGSDDMTSTLLNGLCPVQTRNRSILDGLTEGPVLAVLSET